MSLFSFSLFELLLFESDIIKLMKIVKAPNSALIAPSKPVTKIDKDVLRIIEDMKTALLTTQNPKGVGLAASQIGVPLRIFITKPREKGPIDVFINPEILERSKDQTEGVPERDNKFEGCLSLNNIWGIVRRAKMVKLRYQLITNNSELVIKTRTFTGFLATIIQHEVDHLNGIMFTQRVLEQKGKLFKITGKDKEGDDVFEQIEL